MAGNIPEDSHLQVGELKEVWTEETEEDKVWSKGTGEEGGKRLKGKDRRRLMVEMSFGPE
jgi:hypothetical protein